MKHFNYDNIDITNDFMFGYVMSDPKRCKLFLEQILDIQIDHVEYLEKQKTIDMKIDARSVRLDIYMSDGKTIYNVEMQTSSGKNLPKRSRYYQGQIDMDYFNNSEVVKNSKNPLIHSIDAAVQSARNNEEWRHDYMTWKMYGDEKYEAGKEEGRIEGKEEGRIEGREEGRIVGRQEERKETAVRMFAKGLDIEMIAELVGETEETIEQWLMKK